MNEPEYVPVDDDGNELSPRGAPKWTEIKDDLAYAFMKARRPANPIWKSREERILWKNVRLAIDTGRVTLEWVNECHARGVKPVQAAGSVGIMIPRWSWKVFCTQAADEEKCRDWLSATNIRRRADLKAQSAGLDESPDEFRGFNQDQSV
jgi:hypothetical protein